MSGFRFSCLALCLAGGAAFADPLNIVVIVADNQSAEAIGAYGNRDVATPHIDRLARDGIRFDRAYAASGMCSPTRATLLTGLMPSQHGLHDALHDAWVEQQQTGWSAIAEFRTLPLTLANRGYQTAMIGKWHIGDPTHPSLGFQHWVALPYGHTTDFWQNELVENGSRYPVENRHIVDVFAEKAVAYHEALDASQPFYLQLNLDGPYALPPSNYGPARNRHYAHHVGQQFQSMPREPIHDQILSRLDGPFEAGKKLSELRGSAIWDHLLYGTIRMQGDPESYANFLSQNEMVDDAVGRVRATLEKRGLAEETLIVYTADQGNLYGQHGTWGHTIWFTPAHLYEQALRIPLLVVHPRATAGRTSERLVGQYDLAPTLLEIAGIEGVEFTGSPGQSFATALRDPEAAKDASEVAKDESEAVFFEEGETRGVRTRRYAYWKRLEGFGEPALFDMQADPEQRHDIFAELARDPSGRAVIARLDDLLEGFFAKYSDPDHDLWHQGTSKGTPSKPDLWLRHQPWPWLKKYWRDYVSKPESAPAFAEQL
ncbi:MAG: sulfatase-like hydrolase/transferase [Deltaproteobacteria bacterium]|nr:sulfatase-like hydrolase/transferase [Deltaproteobacteria bacterium]